MTATNHFVARFKARYCNSNCITQVLDEPNFPLAILPHVADVCAIKNTFLVGSITPKINTEGFVREVKFLLCDKIGIPVAYLTFIRDEWFFSLTNKRAIKDRGTNCEEINSVKPQYIIKTIKKNYTRYTNAMPSVAHLLAEIGYAGEKSIEVLLNGNHISQAASVTVDAIVAAVEALQSGKGMNTLNPQHQMQLVDTYEHAQRNVVMRERINQEFKENILDKEFYAVLQLSHTGFVIVAKIKAHPGIKDRHNFVKTDALARYTQTTGFNVFRSFDHMKEAMPQMGGDIDFQAEMMRQALRSLGETLTMDDKDKVLGLKNEAKYFKELNIIRRPTTNDMFLNGTLTMMEVA